VDIFPARIVILLKFYKKTILTQQTDYVNILWLIYGNDTRV